MDNWSFGVTVTVVGMGGTLLTLWILSLVTTLLKKAFPPEDDAHSTKRA
jgi:Na+-transporting methylmalonyl-CoA/oxaloacetate decarboxylase gamma subunit